MKKNMIWNERGDSRVGAIVAASGDVGGSLLVGRAPAPAWMTEGCGLVVDASQCPF